MKRSLPHPRRVCELLALVVLTMLLATVDAEPPKSDATPGTAASPKEALAKFNSLIGGWRGVGQPRRGSNRGAWSEKAEWVWEFGDDSVAIRYDVSDGKLLESGRLTYDPDTKQYRMSVVTPDDHKQTYTGNLSDNRLTLVSDVDEQGEVHRISVTLLNDKRTLVLHEKRPADRETFFRVAEVGYTRQGVRLARAGGNQPECIVTGGLGTIEVSYEGKTYYVCCSGCKQAFEDDPEGILAEAAERHKREARTGP